MTALWFLVSLAEEAAALLDPRSPRSVLGVLAAAAIALPVVAFILLGGWS